LRQAVLDLAGRLQEQDWARHAIATLVGLPARTLRLWQQQQRWGSLRVRARGRPTQRSPLEQRQRVLELLRWVGPGLGLPSLQACFPQVSRAELADLLARYRRLWRGRHGELLWRLHWTTPGTVWAVDFAEPPLPVDARDPYLLAVRDLASGQQLLWQPLAQATAAAVAETLTSLFVLHGPPLVLKSDNGSAFCAGAVQALLAGAEVIPLFSPPYWPRYNGSVEAGIGSLKGRTERQAARAGRPGQWTWHDAEAARQEANAMARPHGAQGPTPDELWQGRPRISTEGRERFAASVARCRQEVRQEAGRGSEQEPVGDEEEAARERQAIQRALVEHDLLSLSRRRIPSPLPKPKVTFFS
jgi:transposase InsO family protein